MARPANPELRDRILKAAAGIIEDCGPDCVTMRQVAEEIGYSTTTLYLYFKDKNDILREAILIAADSLADACDIAMVGPTNLDKYRQRVRGYVMWGLMNPGHYQLMFEGEPAGFEGDEIRRVMRAVTEGAAVLADAAQAGEFRPVPNLETFADAAWAATHGAVSLGISRRLAASDAADASLKAQLDATTTIADFLLNSLLSTAGA